MQLSGGITQLLTATCVADLRAVTTPLVGDVDLNDVAGDDGFLFVRDGVGVAGRGVAAHVGGDAVAVLAAIDHDDRAGLAGCGPVAIGTIPYRPGGEPSLVIPARDRRPRRRRPPLAHRRLPRRPDRPSGAPCRRPLPRRRPPVPSRSRPITAVETYLAAVSAAREAVRAGRLVKAVIAREVGITSEQPDLRARHPRPTARRVRVELPLQRRRVGRRVARAADRGPRRHGAQPPARRHGAAHRRSERRRPHRRRA